MHGIPGGLGHGRQRPGHGLRQHGRRLGTGVAFTRDPSTGENRFYGEFLMNAQGEDVVAGIRTPQHDRQARRPPAARRTSSSRDIRHKLEKHYRDMQDIEFTIQGGRLWMLQSRNGKRTGAAAVRIAVEMVRGGADHEGRGALARRAGPARPVPAPGFEPKAKQAAVTARSRAGQGPAGRPGRRVRQSSSRPRTPRRRPRGETVILVRVETVAGGHPRHDGGRGHPDRARRHDIHAALVARQMGKVCVAGCDALSHQLRGAPR